MYCSECGEFLYIEGVIEVGTEVVDGDVWVVSADLYDCFNCGNVFTIEYLDYCLSCPGFE